MAGVTRRSKAQKVRKRGTDNTTNGRSVMMAQGATSELESLEEAREEIASLASALQEQRRRATLMDAELFQLREARENLERRLSVARAEAEASKARRKEMARVIGNRDARILACYQEMAILERYILGHKVGGPITRLRSSVARLGRFLRKRLKLSKT